VRFSWNDEITKSDIRANLTHLDTRIETFDPDNLIYEIPEINIDGLRLQMVQGLTSNPNPIAPIPTETALAESPSLDLQLGDISLKNISMNLRSEDAGLDTHFDLNELAGKINELQMEQEYVDISSLEVNGLTGSLTLKENQTVQDTSQDTTTIAASNNWRARLNAVALKNIAFNFKDDNIAPTPMGIDYGDMELTNMNLEARDIYYSLDSI